MYLKSHLNSIFTEKCYQQDQLLLRFLSWRELLPLVEALLALRPFESKVFPYHVIGQICNVDTGLEYAQVCEERIKLINKTRGHHHHHD